VKRIFLEETPSTQDEAFRLLQKYPIVLVIARRQTAGRGRRGHTWWSPEGGLYLSIGWKELEAEKALLLNLIAPLSIVELLREVGIESRIKLPNDIVIHDRKIAGILVEQRGKDTVLGIGLNVNQTSFPPGMGATSLKLLTGQTYDIDGIVESLLSKLSKHMERPMEDLAREFSLYLLRKPLEFKYRGHRVEDTILEINPNLEARGLKGTYMLPWIEEVRPLPSQD